MSVPSATDSFWSTLDPYTQCRITALARTPSDASSPAPPGISRSAGPGMASSRVFAKFWHPDNLLFWFGAIGIVTAGSMVLSSGTVNAGGRAHARVGPVAGEAEAEIGHEHEEK